MKKKITISFVLLLTTLCIVGGFFLIGYVKEKKQKAVELGYMRQNFALRISKSNLAMGFDGDDKYHNYDSVRLPGDLYARLLLYKYDTGNDLTMEEIKEYLSKEYEDDGSQRMSKNHPKIQEFIDFICYADGYAKSGEKLEIDGDIFFAPEGRLKRFEQGLDYARSVLPAPYNVDDPLNKNFVYFGNFPKEIIEQAVDWVFESGWMDLKTDEEYDAWRVKYKGEEYGAFRAKYKND